MQDSVNFKFMLDKYFNKTLIVVLLLLLFYLGYSTFFVEPIKKKLIGNKAPLFQTTSIQKQPFHLKNLIGTRVILVNFWATWCPSCQDEVGMLNRIYERIDKNAFSIVAVMEDSQLTIEKLREVYSTFEAAYPILYPVYVDPDNHIADMYGTHKLPETYLIDLGGDVLYKHEGPITSQDADILMAMIEQIMY